METNKKYFLCILAFFIFIQGSNLFAVKVIKRAKKPKTPAEIAVQAAKMGDFEKVKSVVKKLEDQNKYLKGEISKLRTGVAAKVGTEELKKVEKVLDVANKHLTEEKKEKELLEDKVEKLEDENRKLKIGTRIE